MGLNEDVPFLLFVCPFSPACVLVLFEMKVFIFCSLSASPYHIIGIVSYIIGENCPVYLLIG